MASITRTQEVNGADIDPHLDEGMDSFDKHILSIIQSNFPLSSRPYALIAEQVGLEEKEVFERVLALKDRKIIRRMGANFQSAKLGFLSTLCAAKVPEDKLDSFIPIVNGFTEVTHNYLRRHDYNIWFTCIAPSKAAMESILGEITEKTGIAILNLPATRLYKIKVNFDLQNAE